MITKEQLGDEQYLDFCMRCGADAELKDKIFYIDGVRRRFVFWHCQNEDCRDERYLCIYPTQKQGE